LGRFFGKTFGITSKAMVAKDSFDQGLKYYNGTGVLRNYQEAVIHFKAAADMGNVDAQLQLGLMYLSGKAVGSSARSERLSKRDHQANNIDENYLTVEQFNRPVPINGSDPDEAMKYFNMAAKQGSEIAQFEINKIERDKQEVVQKNPPPSQQEDAKEPELESLMLKAEQGDADAQYNLGKMFYDGHGLDKNYTEAMKWYRLAAAQGNAKAQFNLGGMLERGQGVIAQDRAEAMKWYRLAAEQGNADAQLTMGNMFYDGHGVAQDYKEAMKWYRLAAEQGDARAQVRLGAMFMNGYGVEKNDTEAMRWYHLAAEQNNQHAKRFLQDLEAQNAEKARIEAIRIKMNENSSTTTRRR
jgi:TPR repeat protein